MKVLWLTNLPLPVFEKELLNKQTVVKEGWVTGLYNQLKNNSEIKLAICFPFPQISGIIQKDIEKCSFFAFPKPNKPTHCYDAKTETYLRKILSIFQPDIVQIWGTEYPHALAMTKVFNLPEKTLIHIQGLCYICAQHYLAGINSKKQFKKTFRDIIKQDNLVQQCKKFKLRGQNEIEAIKNAGHIIGRTNWDRVCTNQINPDAQYHFCQEALRDEFFMGYKWDVDKCNRHTIFVSQANYPIKGFHFLLQAMPFVLQRFPNAKIITTGDDFIHPVGLRNKLKVSGYQKYTLMPLIKKYHLENKIKFLGWISAEQMKEQYLSANVHVNPSTVENSSNSIAEARLLGVPTVASYVGGSIDIIEHKKDGFCYQSDATYILADYICQIFSDDELAAKLSVNSIEAENKRSDRGAIMSTVLDIYKKTL